MHRNQSVKYQLSSVAKMDGKDGNYPPTHTHKLVNTGKRGPPIVPLLFIL